MQGMAETESGRQVRILILEDQASDAQLCERELKQLGLQFVSRCVDTLASFEAELDRFSPDLVLSDFTFPGGFDGLAALATTQRKLPGVPFIFVSGTIGEDRAVEAIRHGATDYVLKDRMGRLGTAVQRALELARVRREKELAEAALRESEARYEQKIEKLSRVRSMTSEINAAIIRSSSRPVLYYEACRIAVELGNFGIAWVGSFDALNMELTPVASAGLEGDTLLSTTKLVIRDDAPQRESTLAVAIRERRPAYNNDIVADAVAGGKRRQEAIRRGYRSVIGLPLIVEGNVVATFSLFAKERNFFDDEEVRLLAELAGNISFALESIAQREKLDKLSRIRAVSGEINAAIVRIGEREALLRETCRIAAEHGRFGLAWVAEIDQAAQRVRPVSWVGISEEAAHAVSWESITSAHGTLGEAIRTQRTAVRNDIGAGIVTGKLRQEAVKAGYLSTVSLPLVVGDGVVALVSLFAIGRDFFDEEELALLNEVAADVSFGLQSIAQREKVEYLSYYDGVTGLPNRTLFLDRTGQQMRSRGGEPMMVALILLNLERFRNINDAFGRGGGDELLVQVAQRLEKAFRGKDYIARTGADGFGIVVRGIRDAEAVVRIVDDQVLDCFREPYLLDGRELRVGAKAGVAMFPADGGDADTLFRNAEAALKKARDSGDRYLFYAAEMNARAAQVLSLETRLRVAVEQRQFVLHYQPKVGLGSGKDGICGLEALIRWREPSGDLVPPGTFIPLLEETGLILEVGRWVLAQALADHHAWKARGIVVPRIAVNVSPIQLQQRDFADMVIATVHQGGDHPEALELEVTESLLMRDVQESIRKLSVLRSVGIHIAMDDFGTGYSSLSYIARLPINSVKIDRSFITGMAGSPQDMAIVTTIIALGHSLNLRVVAEGVETNAQAQLLALLKCDEAQGYLYSKPLPAAEIEPLLRLDSAEPASPAG
jgi:diguanylate cyclase (GGDEF)-like protein